MRPVPPQLFNIRDPFIKISRHQRQENRLVHRIAPVEIAPTFSKKAQNFASGSLSVGELFDIDCPLLLRKRQIAQRLKHIQLLEHRFLFGRIFAVQIPVDQQVFFFA
jgi:hypothetical protein